MKTSTDTKRGAEPRIDLAAFARRALVVVAAGAALFGILAGRPVLTVAWRAAAIACAGLLAIAVAERVTRAARSARQTARGGTR